MLLITELIGFDCVIAVLVTSRLANWRTFANNSRQLLSCLYTDVAKFNDNNTLLDLTSNLVTTIFVTDKVFETWIISNFKEFLKHLSFFWHRKLLDNNAASKKGKCSFLKYMIHQGLCWNGIHLLGSKCFSFMLKCLCRICFVYPKMFTTWNAHNFILEVFWMVDLCDVLHEMQKDRLTNHGYVIILKNICPSEQK